MNILRACCVQCQQVLAIAAHGLCCRCYRNIPRYSYCGRCGSRLQENAPICGRCLRQKPNWDQIVVASEYRKPLSDLIHRFKFQNQFWLDRTLARLLYLAIRQAKRTHGIALPEAVFSVPLYHTRQWQRNYNQADLLARYLATYLRLPYHADVLWRVKNTPSQRGLSAKARRLNMENAFTISNKITQFSYGSVALVDDVITTGSTLNEIAKQLRQQGIAHIQVWGLCKT
ncbi:amidophosphoribosyltransferase [Conservatibacter flavescens]|uniref:Amidophosphoribosyltransferase n=1 Tax=Conservatibacter flavescens TaxID=28161 RepID=A0A2M8RZL0_9PAST|nr:amidophosphoribosyltransferase [Conservatibacter flavescens]PJG84325.1 amidophosphoribosyltransferase [Conservatibacter flavescens]